MRAAELEVLFTANTTKVEKAEKDVKAAGTRIEGKPIEAKVDANAKPALEGMEQVEQAAKRIVSAETIARVDADITAAEAGAEKIRGELDYLRALSTDVQVDADIAAAESKLQRTERTLDGLRSARATMEVDADVSAAESELDGLADEADDTLGEGGESGGASLGAGIIAGLATIPIVGAVAAIGKAAVDGLLDAFNDGLQVEVRQDRLQALTGISEADAGKFGRIASEAYTQGFGESIADNMDAARIALQGGLLDVNGTKRDSQQVIQSLAGIADVLGEEVGPISTAVTTMLRAGLIKTSQEGFDLLAAGAREGVNAQEDLLDTLTEYPALFSRLGLSGEQALGLVNQGLLGGARNSDLAADALKEFQIRATDGSEASAEGFKLLGLNAKQMTADIAAGGDTARAGLDTVLDRLREIEDPVQRNAAAVALFGTQAEDLGEALFNMDLSTAVESLNGVTGAAQSMFDTIASNDASEIENARRNIEVAADGMKGALAAAFADPLAAGAAFVAENRGPMLEFMTGLANGAIEFGIALINAAANGTEALGDFATTTLPPVLNTIRGIVEGIDKMTPGDQGSKEFGEFTDQMISDLILFDAQTKISADGMRNEFIPPLEDAQTRLNNFAAPAIADGYLHDATLRLAGALDQVGYDAEGAQLSLDGLDTANLSASDSGRVLEGQILAAAGALGDELDAARKSGEGQAELTGRYNTTRDALIRQVEQMGIGKEAAGRLVDQILKTPSSASTAYSSNSDAEKAKVDNLASRIVTLPDGSVVIDASTSAASRALDIFVSEQSRRVIRMNVAVNRGSLGDSGVSMQHDGSVLMPMAAGGTLTPMAKVAQHVPANTWRVIGDRMDVVESFIPHDGSARSRAILLDTMRAFGMLPMEAGGVVSAGASSTPGAPLTALLGEGEMERFALVVAAAIEGRLQSRFASERRLRRA